MGPLRHKRQCLVTTNLPSLHPFSFHEMIFILVFHQFLASFHFVVYNTKQFECNTSIDTFKGVSVKTIGNDESEKEESENDETCSDEDVHRGSVGEMKLSIEERNKAQLFGGMTKLCGELAYSAVQSCKIFKKIEVYGFLINMTDLQSHVAKLHWIL